MSEQETEQETPPLTYIERIRARELAQEEVDRGELVEEGSIDERS